MFPFREEIENTIFYNRIFNLINSIKLKYKQYNSPPKYINFRIEFDQSMPCYFTHQLFYFFFRIERFVCN